MKTVTEFFGKNLRTIEEQMTKLAEEATTVATETLTAEGKAGDELTAALPEATKTALHAKLTELTKLEGEKLSWLQTALGLIKGKKGSLKRVIVQQLNEGEKAPTSGNQEIEGKYYTIEFFPEPARAAQASDRDEGRFGGRGGRGGRGDKKGGRGGRDDKRGGGDRAPRGENRGPRPEGAVIKIGGGAPRPTVAADGTVVTEFKKPRRPGRGEPRPPMSAEQLAQRDAERAERAVARTAKNAEFEAKRTAAAAAETPYDGKTNRIKVKAPGSASATAEQSSEQSTSV